tara:strand:- start:14 stop:265 length:252 start_codon:yes stop_codon:yes gene_type:complete
MITYPSQEINRLLFFNVSILIPITAEIAKTIKNAVNLIKEGTHSVPRHTNPNEIRKTINFETILNIMMTNCHPPSLVIALQGS